MAADMLFPGRWLLPLYAAWPYPARPDCVAENGAALRGSDDLRVNMYSPMDRCTDPRTRQP